jgi:two-component system LytT family response regulator
LLEEPKRDKYLERIVIKASGRISFLNVEEIDWIEAADNYVQLHVGRDSHLVHGTLSKLEGGLNPEKFLRVHRSTIINLTRVKEIRPLFHGEYSILLLDGTELTSSRTYRDRLEPLLANTF